MHCYPRCSFLGLSRQRWPGHCMIFKGSFERVFCTIVVEKSWFGAAYRIVLVTRAPFSPDKASLLLNSKAVMWWHRTLLVLTQILWNPAPSLLQIGMTRFLEHQQLRRYTQPLAEKRSVNGQLLAAIPWCAQEASVVHHYPQLGLVDLGGVIF